MVYLAGCCGNYHFKEGMTGVGSGSSVVEWRTRSQVRPGSNPPLLPFRRFGILVLSIDVLVDSAV